MSGVDPSFKKTFPLKFLIDMCDFQILKNGKKLQLIGCGNIFDPLSMSWVPSSNNSSIKGSASPNGSNPDSQVGPQRIAFRNSATLEQMRDNFLDIDFVNDHETRVAIYAMVWNKSK